MCQQGVQNGARLQSTVYLVEIQQLICRLYLVKGHRLLKHLSYQLKSDSESSLLKANINHVFTMFYITI